MADRQERHSPSGSAQTTNEYVRIKCTQETGRINAAVGGVVYVILDGTNATKFFSASVDEDAYIELITVEDEATMLSREKA